VRALTGVDLCAYIGREERQFEPERHAALVSGLSVESILCGAYVCTVLARVFRFSVKEALKRAAECTLLKISNKVASFLLLDSVLHDCNVSHADFGDLSRYRYLPSRKDVSYRTTEIKKRLRFCITAEEQAFYFGENKEKKQLPQERFIDLKLVDFVFADAILYATRAELLYSPAYSIYYVPPNVWERLAVYVLFCIFMSFLFHTALVFLAFLALAAVSYMSKKGLGCAVGDICGAHLYVKMCVVAGSMCCVWNIGKTAVSGMAAQKRRAEKGDNKAQDEKGCDVHVEGCVGDEKGWDTHEKECADHKTEFHGNGTQRGSDETGRGGAGAKEEEKIANLQTAVTFFLEMLYLAFVVPASSLLFAKGMCYLCLGAVENIFRKRFCTFLPFKVRETFLFVSVSSGLEILVHGTTKAMRFVCLHGVLLQICVFCDMLMFDVAEETERALLRCAAAAVVFSGAYLQLGARAALNALRKIPTKVKNRNDFDKIRVIPWSSSGLDCF